VGDGSVLAFAITRHERELRGSSEVAVISGRFRAVDIASRPAVVRQLATDGGRVAVLWDDGVVEVRGLRGRLLQRFELGAVRAIALSGDSLLALRDTGLDVYSLEKAQRVSSWVVPRDVRAIDMHYGIVVFGSGGAVYGLDLRSGRRAVLGRAAGAFVGAQIEAAGVSYAYNLGGRGVARFVPIAAVQQALGHT
jgi:hypothetical protein